MSLPVYTSATTAAAPVSTAYVPPPPPQPYLPSVSWSTGIATLSDLNEVATLPADQQAQVSADNAPLRIVYGRTRIGAQIADVLTYGTSLVLIAVWCEGEIEAVESVEINDAAAPTGVTITSYTGTSGQTANATLVAAYASHGITYADTLAGVAYSVVVVAAGAVDGFPQVSAIIKGRKVYDPRSTLTAYSDNPALCLADFVESTTYGMSRDVNWASVETVADFADELCGSEKRRLLGLCIDSPAPCSQWIEALRTYAGCWLSQEGSEILLVPDTTAASTFAFTDANIVAGSLRLKKRGVQQVPTVVEVRWTDTTVTPWAEKPAIAKLGGVDEGTTPRRESQVSLPGVQRYSQAYREAVERLNKLNTSDLSCEFTTFDEALAVQIGDVVTVTHSIGLASKLMRVTGIAALEPGRWRITAVEYDPAAYSDTVSAEPSYTDTDLPSPAAPPALSGLTATEEVYQLDNGTYSSRILMVWIAADYAYLRDYRVEVYRLGELIATATPREAVWRSGPVQEGVEYVCKVASISSIGAVGEWAQANLTAQGKALVPGNVGSVSLFEVGGTVYASWTAAVDLDIWRYEVRYGTTGGSWDTATLIDRVDALRLSTNMLPVGTWRIHVKALDSVGQYSTTAAYADVTVTADAGAFLVNAYDQTTPALTNMASFRLAPTDSNLYYVTDDGVAFGTTFPNTLDTYTDPLATYHASVTSTWLGESDDFGQILSGQWTGTATVAALSGTATSYLGVSSDGTNWDYLEGLSQKNTARFARLKHESLTTGTLLVTVPTQNIRLDAVPREDVGFSTSSASAATLVQLANNYSAVKRLLVTAEGTAARIATYDRILVGPEDGLCLWDTSDGGGDSYVRQTISTSGRTIAAGDYLEYDVFVHERPGAVAGGVGGMQMRFTDSSFSSAYTLVDALGNSLGNPTIQYGKWQSRKIDLTNVVGKTVSHWFLFRNADTAGDYKAVHRSIRITDGAGTDLLSLWASGEPTVNTNYSTVLSSNVMCGPANSFNVYVFDAAGTQVANDFSYVFQGV